MIRNLEKSHNYYASPVFSLQTDSAYINKIHKDDAKYKPCVIPFISAKIDSNGECFICGHDFSEKYPIGNLSVNDFSQVYNGEKAKDLRNAILRGDIEFFIKIGYNCHLCNMWNIGIGYNFEEYLQNTLPVVTTLSIEQHMRSSINYPIHLIENLSKQINLLQAGILPHSKLD